MTMEGSKKFYDLHPGINQLDNNKLREFKTRHVAEIHDYFSEENWEKY